MEQKKLIQFRNIVKDFDGQIVLKGINLDIYENEFVTLLGPSGCGKTTLLRILGGFLDANEGAIIFDGQDIAKVPPHKRELNTVFQKYALFPHMSEYRIRAEDPQDGQGRHRAEGDEDAQADRPGGL